MNRESALVTLSAGSSLFNQHMASDSLLEKTHTLECVFFPLDELLSPTLDSETYTKVSVEKCPTLLHKKHMEHKESYT